MLTWLLACTQPNEDPRDTGRPVDTADADMPDTADTGDGAYAEAFSAVRLAVRGDLRTNAASGASVAIWKDGEIIYAEGFGTRHPDTEQAVEPTTLFQIGSDTKKISAIALLRQVEAGRLSLDDTLADALPGLSFAHDPALAGSITLRQLLSHQTGIYDYTPWSDAPDDADLAGIAYGRFAENEFSLTPSGTCYNYSNPNFALAGLVAEQADGRAWADLVAQDIFAPLGMDRTFGRLTEAAADGDYATGYGLAFPDGYDSFGSLGDDPSYTYGTVEMADQVDNAFIRPAGLVWSTASDMARLMAFLVDGDSSVLSDALRAEIAEPHVAMYPGMDAAIQGYGYGLMVLSSGFSGPGGWYATPLWLHGGNTMTMTSAFYVLPEQRLAVSVLSNGYGDNFGNTAATAMLELGDLPEPGEVPELLGAALSGEDLVGTWVDANSVGTLTLTWDGDAVRVDAPELTAAGLAVGDTLEPYAEDLWLLAIEGTDHDLSVYRDADGAPTWLVNRQFAWTRVDDAVARAAARPATAPRPRLGPLVDPAIPTAARPFVLGR